MPPAADDQHERRMFGEESLEPARDAHRIGHSRRLDADEPDVVDTPRIASR